MISQSKPSAMYRSYHMRLKPSAAQREALLRALAISCDLYNAALQERRDAWRQQRKGVTYSEQTAQLTEVREADEEIAALAVDIAREPLRRVRRAFSAFFRRVKNGEKPGYPRFRSRERYVSLTYHRPRIRHGRLAVPNLGSVAFRAHRDLQGLPKYAVITRRGNRWFARITCDVGPAPPKVPVSSAVGIDVGLTALATLSNGSVIANPRWLRNAEQRIARAAQRLCRKQKHSKNRVRAKLNLRRAHARTSNARNNYLHHISKWLVGQYDLIAFERLKISNMARGSFGKSIMDAAWGKLLDQISYKAESAGRYAIAVNPRGTSQTCSGCGAKVVKSLAERSHSCPVCLLTLNRDHNAAINILRLGVSLAGISVPSERGFPGTGNMGTQGYSPELVT